MANILIVDDDPAVQLTIRLLLEQKPFRADALLAAVDRRLISAPSSCPPRIDAGTGSR
ncbi:response regulator [Bradyrhizobium monzae]|uniref:response regulator n=1 Tax=Bradyrhizobium sp. Oc8 TaxID=2876780 RepID=UPI001F357F68|nr:response regulator [Bradyrhizobium sp. Oc8]